MRPKSRLRANQLSSIIRRTKREKVLAILFDSWDRYCKEKWAQNNAEIRSMPMADEIIRLSGWLKNATQYVTKNCLLSAAVVIQW